MRVHGTAIVLLALLLAVPTRAAGPATTTTTTAAKIVGQPPFRADGLTLTAAGADVWDQGSLSVVQLTGPVRIDLGPAAVLGADAAVVWLRPKRADGVQPVDLVLVGHATVQIDKITYSYDRYWVPAEVTGTVRLVGPRTARVSDASATYRAASALLREQRPSAAAATRVAAAAATTTAPASDVVPLPEPAAAPARSPKAVSGLDVGRTDLQQERTADGDLALVGTGGVRVSYRHRDPREAKDTLLEFTADSMVLFTDLKQTRDANQGGGSATDHVTAGYFEGDVRVFTTPGNAGRNELRVRAERVYYEFATDRAVMDDVVFHTVDARKGVPIFIRAAAVRQLSQGEFKADDVKLTTSAFATPTYGLSAAHAYVRTESSGDPRLGERVNYSVENVQLQAFGVPVLYLPGAGGTMTARGSVFRGVGIENSNQFGTGGRTDWGLFETFGQPPPPNVDADYRLDYFSYRGFAGGINGSYNGGGSTDVDRQPVTFAGDLHSYFVPDDQGVDILGAARQNREPLESFRGRVRYEHTHDVGDDVTVQVRGGWESDSNFLQQYFLNEFQNDLPLDESLYVKRQHGSELISGRVQLQPNGVVSTSEFVAENREVNHLPELKYQRAGDSLLGDRLTFFSDDSAAGLQFAPSDLRLRQQGFVDVPDNRRPLAAFPTDFGTPGRPAFAYTGDPGDVTWRGDARQEVDVPLHLGPVNLVPYVVGRYTGYTQGVVPPANLQPSRRTLNVKRDAAGQFTVIPTVTSGGENRFLGAAGVRLTTDLWRVDDAVQSDLFDLHRVRHVISPEVTAFVSSQSRDQNRLVIYDPQVDALNDVQALQVALKQRWQTKRGGPGQWRSVDFLSLDLYANLFANQPSVRVRDPVGFRSTFFQQEPEYSLPRNTANADVTWRLSDTTAILGSVVHNLDRQALATASVGLAVTRGERLSYFIGTRYIAELNSNVATLEGSYQLDRKYSLSASESVDLAQSRNVYYSAQIIRHFDTFSAAVEAHYDQASNSEGFGFSVSPNGLARGLGSDQANPANRQLR